MTAGAVVLSGCAVFRSSQGLNAELNTVSTRSEVDTAGIYAPLQVEDLPPVIPQQSVFLTEHPALDAQPFRLDKIRRESPGLVQAGSRKKVVEGYRIQLMAVRDRSSAVSFEEMVRLKLEGDVYLVYEAPQYKVRLGNFMNRDDAVQLANQLRREGFPDAWVVRSLVDIGKQTQVK